MRVRIIQTSKVDATVLSISTGFGEHVVEKELGWLSLEQSDYLTKPRVERRGSSATLYYGMGAGVGLDQACAKKPSPIGLSTILVSLVDTMGSCVLGNVDWHGLLLDVSNVFYIDAVGLRFIFVPIQHKRKTRNQLLQSDLTRFLRQIVKIYKERSGGSRWIEQIETYIEDSRGNPTFSSFCLLLQEDLALALPENAAVALSRISEDTDPVPQGKMQPNDTEERSVSWRGVQVKGSFDAFQRDAGGVAGPVAVGVRPGIVSDSPAQFELVRLVNGTTYTIEAGQRARLGRGSTCEVQLLGNPKISREHAAVTCVGNSAVLIDLGSANGTWIDGYALPELQERRIAFGQSFMIANERFLIRDSGAKRGWS